MSKSLENCIYLTDDAAAVEKRVRGMYTDPKRVRADIPGTVEGNPVFLYHDIFNPNKAEVDDLKQRYRAGKVGDVEVKKKLAAAINAFLEPIRVRRAALKPGDIDAVVAAGNARARQEARRTMEQVRRLMYGA
jgi:tryptophanyl-tRNA synthetase